MSIICNFPAWILHSWNEGKHIYCIFSHWNGQVAPLDALLSWNWMSLEGEKWYETLSPPSDCSENCIFPNPFYQTLIYSMSTNHTVSLSSWHHQSCTRAFYLWPSAVQLTIMSSHSDGVNQTSETPHLTLACPIYGISALSLMFGTTESVHLYLLSLNGSLILRSLPNLLLPCIAQTQDY